MVSYDLVSMAASLRDFERPKYLNKEHQLLTDIADSLYNVGINPNDFGAEYKDLYNQYGKAFWDKVIADMGAIDSQVTSDRGARELAADYYDRVGDADFYEDYYGSYEGSSDGYGVYSYRNGQEDSYTYAKDYDEALRDAKWDLTHKNYIDVVRIIDNVTGEVVGEFDSLDSIGESYKKDANKNHYPKYVTRDGYRGTFRRVDPGVDGEEIPIYRFPGGESMVDDYELDNGYDEGCSPRKKKSSEKKILNQGCGSKKRRSERLLARTSDGKTFDDQDKAVNHAKARNLRVDYSIDDGKTWDAEYGTAAGKGGWHKRESVTAGCHGKRSAKREGRNDLHHYFDDLDDRFSFELDDEFEIYLDTTTAHIPCYVVDSNVFGNGAGMVYTVAVAIPSEDAHWQITDDIERNLERYIQEQTDGSDYTGWVEDSDYTNAMYDVPDEVFDTSKLYTYDICVVPYQNIGPYGDYGIDAGVLESRRTRRSAKKEACADPSGRYEVFKDFNTKDWIIYDNRTNRNLYHFDSEKEACDYVNKLLNKI